MKSLARQEAAKLIEQEKKRRKVLRLEQAREQASTWMEANRKKYENEKEKQYQILTQRVLEEARTEALGNIDRLVLMHDLTLAQIGSAHRAATAVEDYEKIRDVKMKQNIVKAKERGIEALRLERTHMSKAQERAMLQDKLRKKVRWDEDRKSKILVELKPYNQPSPSINLSEETLKPPEYQQRLSQKLFIPLDENGKCVKKSVRFKKQRGKKLESKGGILRKPSKKRDQTPADFGIVADERLVKGRSPKSKKRPVSSDRESKGRKNVVSYFDASQPGTQVKYVAPKGLTKTHDFPMEPSAWELGQEMNNDPTRMEEASRRKQMEENARQRGLKALRIARLEKKYKELENQLISEDHKGKFGVVAGISHESLLGLEDSDEEETPTGMSDENHLKWIDEELAKLNKKNSAPFDTSRLADSSPSDQPDDFNEYFGKLGESTIKSPQLKNLIPKSTPKSTSKSTPKSTPKFPDHKMFDEQDVLDQRTPEGIIQTMRPDLGELDESTQSTREKHPFHPEEETRKSPITNKHLTRERVEGAKSPLRSKSTQKVQKSLRPHKGHKALKDGEKGDASYNSKDFTDDSQNPNGEGAVGGFIDNGNNGTSGPRKRTGDNKVTSRTKPRQGHQMGGQRDHNKQNIQSGTPKGKGQVPFQQRGIHDKPGTSTNQNIDGLEINGENRLLALSRENINISLLQDPFSRQRGNKGQEGVTGQGGREGRSNLSQQRQLVKPGNIPSNSPYSPQRPISRGPGLISERPGSSLRKIPETETNKNDSPLISSLTPGTNQNGSPLISEGRGGHGQVTSVRGRRGRKGHSPSPSGLPNSPSRKGRNRSRSRRRRHPNDNPLTGQMSSHERSHMNAEGTIRQLDNRTKRPKANSHSLPINSDGEREGNRMGLANKERASREESHPHLIVTDVDSGNEKRDKVEEIIRIPFKNTKETDKGKDPIVPKGKTPPGTKKGKEKETGENGAGKERKEVNGKRKIKKKRSEEIIEAEKEFSASPSFSELSDRSGRTTTDYMSPPQGRYPMSSTPGSSSGDTSGSTTLREEKMKTDMDAQRQRVLGRLVKKLLSMRHESVEKLPVSASNSDNSSVVAGSSVGSSLDSIHFMPLSGKIDFDSSETRYSFSTSTSSRSNDTSRPGKTFLSSLTEETEEEGRANSGGTNNSSGSTQAEIGIRIKPMGKKKTSFSSRESGKIVGQNDGVFSSTTNTTTTGTENSFHSMSSQTQMDTDGVESSFSIGDMSPIIARLKSKKINDDKELEETTTTVTKCSKSSKSTKSKCSVKSKEHDRDIEEVIEALDKSFLLQLETTGRNVFPFESPFKKIVQGWPDISIAKPKW